jgi:hypothetical protein
MVSLEMKDGLSGTETAQEGEGTADRWVGRRVGR